MEAHQSTYQEIKGFLRAVFKERLIVENQGRLLYIKDEHFWMKTDQEELTIGYEESHQHYSVGDIDALYRHLFNLLTKRIKVTEYVKGNLIYKRKLEIEINSSEFEEIGKSLTLFFPFWKRTKVTSYFNEKIIDETTLKSYTAS